MKDSQIKAVIAAIVYSGGNESWKQSLELAKKFLEESRTADDKLQE